MNEQATPEMKVSESPYGMDETYTVKFWYTTEEGFFRQTDEMVWANSESAHSVVQKYCEKNLAKLYKNFRIISVSRQ